MTLTFTTVRNLKMGLPVGAVSPVDFSKYQGCKAYVIETRGVYKIASQTEVDKCKTTK